MAILLIPRQSRFSHMLVSMELFIDSHWTSVWQAVAAQWTWWTWARRKARRWRWLSLSVTTRRRRRSGTNSLMSSVWSSATPSWRTSSSGPQWYSHAHSRQFDERDRRLKVHLVLVAGGSSGLGGQHVASEPKTEPNGSHQRHLRDEVPQSATVGSL